MELLWDITPEIERVLGSLGFMQTVGHDGGMHKAYEWTNNTMTIGLYYDRGLFDCSITPSKEPRNSIYLIILLRYLDNNIDFYNKELEDVKLWNTLTAAEYFELFFCYYDKINYFLKNYNIESANDIKKFFEKKNTL